MPVADAVPDLSKINIYDAIGLDRDASVSALQQQLHDLKVGWSGKAARQGSLGEQARSILALIAAAEPIFVSEESREEYDLRLRRDPVVQVEDAKIDWVSRAWNYYFVRDAGAARVAARKAREQDAKDVMSWVVSAWVELLGGADEIRTAKNFADEAFVLDDQGNDTTDVYGVRGTVFFVQKDYERALQTFDRALTSASPGERPELLWRKSRVYDATGEFQQAYDVAFEGLTVGVEVDSDTETKLEDSLFQSAILVTANVKDRARIADVTAKRKDITDSQMQQAPKDRLLTRLNSFLTACEEIEAKTARLRTELQVPAAGVKPGVPLISLGIAILNVLLLPVWGQAGGLVMIPILFILGFGGYFVFRLTQRSQVSQAESAFQAAQASIDALRSRLDTLESGVPLRKRINFEFESLR